MIQFWSLTMIHSFFSTLPLFYDYLFYFNIVPIDNFRFNLIFSNISILSPTILTTNLVTHSNNKISIKTYPTSLYSVIKTNNKIYQLHLIYQIISFLIKYPLKISFPLSFFKMFNRISKCSSWHILIILL